MRINNKALARGYAEANKKYFGNRLPKDMVVRFSSYTIPECGYTCLKWDRPLYIILNRKLAWHHMLVEMTLLHEMCHVEQPKKNGHGPWFNKRMLQLAKAGAFNGIW